jgi:hypothetical protein
MSCSCVLWQAALLTYETLKMTGDLHIFTVCVQESPRITRQCLLEMHGHYRVVQNEVDMNTIFKNVTL